MARFNQHSVATGIMADLLVQKVPVHYPEGAFVGGLFHDVGKLLIAITSIEEYEALTRLVETSGQTVEKCEREVLGWTHAELSSAALEQWNLPKLIRLAVEFHHNPDDAPQELSQGKRLNLGHVLHAANCTVNRLGFSIAIPPAGAPRGTEYPELDALGLGVEIPSTIDEFHAELNALKAAA